MIVTGVRMLVSFVILLALVVMVGNWIVLPLDSWYARRRYAKRRRKAGRLDG